MPEVFDCEDNAYASNTRTILRKIMENSGSELEPWLGFEQEYTLLAYLADQITAFLRLKDPGCGVSSTRVCGRSSAQEYTKVYIDARLMIFGINTKVMLG